MAGAGAAPGERYTRVAIAFHWVIAVLVIVNLAIGLFHEGVSKALGGGLPLMPLHKSIGLTVLALSVARVLWRLTHPAPALPSDVPRWQAVAAHGLHWLFYVFLIVMPLTGWIMSSAGDPRRPLMWFWLFDVPYLVPSGSSLGGPAGGAHQVIGWLWVWLAAIHVGAALKHHFVDRDVVLWRMLPAIRRPDRR